AKQAAAMQQAQLAGIQADTEGRRLTNRGIPGRQAAELADLQARMAHTQAETAMLKDAGELGPEGRALSSAFQQGLVPFDECRRRRADRRAGPPPIPPGWGPRRGRRGTAPPMASVPPVAKPTAKAGGKPTAFEAGARLKQRHMPADFAEIFGGDP